MPTTTVTICDAILLQSLRTLGGVNFSCDEEEELPFLLRTHTFTPLLTSTFLSKASTNPIWQLISLFLLALTAVSLFYPWKHGLNEFFFVFISHPAAFIILIAANIVVCKLFASFSPALFSFSLLVPFTLVVFSKCHPEPLIHHPSLLTQILSGLLTKMVRVSDIFSPTPPCNRCSLLSHSHHLGHCRTSECCDVFSEITMPTILCCTCWACSSFTLFTLQAWAAL